MQPSNSASILRVRLGRRHPVVVRAGVVARCGVQMNVRCSTRATSDGMRAVQVAVREGRLVQLDQVAACQASAGSVRRAPASRAGAPVDPVRLRQACAASCDPVAQGGIGRRHRLSSLGSTSGCRPCPSGSGIIATRPPAGRRSAAKKKRPPERAQSGGLGNQGRYRPHLRLRTSGTASRRGAGLRRLPAAGSDRRRLGRFRHAAVGLGRDGTDLAAGALTS